MKVYVLSLRTESPMIITLRSGYGGFIHRSLTDEIPGLMLRGALFTRAIEEGVLTKDNADNLAIKPSHSIIPALFSSRGEAFPLDNLLPSHALCSKSKWSNIVMSPGAHKLAQKDYETILRGLLRDELKIYSKKGKEGIWKPGEVKRVQGRPALKENGRWVLCGKPRTFHYIETALDPTRGAGLPEMLFSYELVDVGSTYCSLIALEDTNPLNSLLERGRVEISVGRGISRGFGKLSVKVVKGDIPKLPKLGKYAVFEAISPLFIMDPLPRPPEPGDVLKIDPNWYLRMTGYKISAELKVREVLGSETLYRGWSLRRNSPRVPVRALSKGSILICETVSGEEGDEVTSYLPVVGLNEYSSLGFNHLLPLDPDPFEVV
ncbi:MAG: hypothetical protein DRJ41_01410 [Thermoprotei archaeon]|nr:MAG: hypothetical protein DRJ41_01410 [Thermoprotei archaeon]